MSKKKKKQKGRAPVDEHEEDAAPRRPRLSWRILLHPLTITLGLSLLSTILISWGQGSDDVIPFGDGRLRVQKAIEMHGLLHAGHFRQFLTVFSNPRNVNFLPTYPIFWLMPTRWATGGVYGILNCFLWNIILAFSLYGTLKIIKRAELAPAVFMLSSANNYALDPSYFFYMDLAYMSCCMFAVWIRLRALTLSTRNSWLTTGLVSASVFFVKPGSAILYFTFEQLFTLFYWGWSFWHAAKGGRRQYLGTIMRQIGTMAITYVPVFLLAAYWQAAQRLVGQIYASQIVGMRWWAFKDYAEISPFMRAFYFPMSLSFFFSFLLMGSLLLILALAGIFNKWSRTDNAIADRRERVAVLCSILSFLLMWGLFFSFAMSTKTIRSTPLMLPFLWIAIFCYTPYRRVRPMLVTALAVIYFSIAHGQAHGGLVEKMEMSGKKVNRWAEVYEFVGDWWNRLPAQRQIAPEMVNLTRHLVSQMAKLGVTEGKIACGSDMMFWNSCSMNWITQIPDMQKGIAPRLEFTTATDNMGNPNELSMDGMNGIILVVHPQVQYSKGVYEFNVKTVQYAQTNWQGTVLKRFEVMRMGQGQPPAAVFLVFKEPFTGEVLDQYMKDLYPNGFSYRSHASNAMGWRRLGWRELWGIFTDLSSKVPPEKQE